MAADQRKEVLFSHVDPQKVYVVNTGNPFWSQLELFPVVVVLFCAFAMVFMLGSPKRAPRIWQTARTLPVGKMYFRPTSDWQEVLADHVLPNGLELRMDFESGRNFARLQPGQEDSAFNHGGDAVAVEKHLSDASTWNQPDRLRQLLSSCYWNVEMLVAPFCEAADRGYLDVCQVLLRARADPLAKAQSLRGSTALHRAMGQGHEKLSLEILRDCLQNGRDDALRIRDDLGRTCLDVAREQDLGLVARRVEAAFEETRQISSRT